MALHEWLTLYVKHKDIIARKLVGCEQKGDKIQFTFKDHVLTGYALDKLEVPKIDGKTIIATLQTKANVQTLISRWKEFCTHKGLTIIFVNPDKNERWLIHPATHESISEGNIELGIWTLANEVSYV